MSPLPFLRLAAVAVVCLLAAGCVSTEPEPHVLYVRGGPPSGPVAVDPARAAAMISAYRAENGLARVVVNPVLNRIAQTQADAMARAGEVSHTVAGSLVTRVNDAGYRWLTVAENVGGGHRSLAEVLDHWELSPGHDANLKIGNVTEIGIATAYSAGSNLRVFWALVLAAPD